MARIHPSAQISWNQPIYTCGVRNIARLAEEQLSELSSHVGVSSVGLSLRETEVLRLVAAGFTDLEIAQRLVLSPRTIHAHLRSIYRKMGVSSRTAAVVAAADLVMPPTSR